MQTSMRGGREGRDGDRPEGEIALIFAAEIELLLGSFAAAPPPEERLSGYLICIGIPSSSAALATAFPVSTRKEGRSARALATELGLFIYCFAAGFCPQLSVNKQFINLNVVNHFRFA